MEPVLNAVGLGSAKQPSVKVEPPPTRDTAAEALAATEAEDKKRRSWQSGTSSQQLTPAGGVQSDFTGTPRMLTGA